MPPYTPLDETWPHQTAANIESWASDVALSQSTTSEYHSPFDALFGRDTTSSPLSSSQSRTSQQLRVEMVDPDLLYDDNSTTDQLSQEDADYRRQAASASPPRHDLTTQAFDVTPLNQLMLGSGDPAAMPVSTTYDDFNGHLYAQNVMPPASHSLMGQSLSYYLPPTVQPAASVSSLVSMYSQPPIQVRNVHS